eukprot:5126752-Pleurochrysis_carterae.AAC.2
MGNDGVYIPAIIEYIHVVPAGSFAIATLLTSAVYNASTAGDSGSWLLQEPFRLTGLVCTVISFLSAAVSMILSRRLRGEYARLRMLHSTEN